MRLLQFKNKLYRNRIGVVKYNFSNIVKNQSDTRIVQAIKLDRDNEVYFVSIKFISLLSLDGINGFTLALNANLISSLGVNYGNYYSRFRNLRT